MKFPFCLNNFGFEIYLFELIVLLKPDFNCSNTFALSWVDKVTTTTWIFVSVIENVAPWFATSVETITQFADQVKIRLISQLVKGISRVLQKLPKYFNGTIISTSFVPSFSVWPVIFSLKLNERVRLASPKSSISPLLFTADISLQYCHKLPDVFE